MIERIARRAGGFASTTAMRWLGVARDAAPEIELPVAKSSNGDRLHKPIRASAVAGALVLVSSNKLVRSEMAKGLRKLTETLRPDTSTGNGSAQKRASSTAGSNGSHANGASAASLSEKTRAELYDMAKKKDVRGRSGMSKEQLAKALASL
jgi:hypothetical protein